MASLTTGLQRPAEFIRRPDDRAPSAVFRFSRFVAKQYRTRSLPDRIKAMVRRPRAKRALDWARTLADIGVATINPVAVAYDRWRPWESYFISDYIAERCTIHEWIESIDSSEKGARGNSPLRKREVEVTSASEGERTARVTHPSDAVQRHWIINALADIMARLHNANISHGDAHLANFIVERVERPRLILVDLDALRRRKMSGSVAARDLKRLLDYAPGSQAQHLRFLVAYSRRRQPRIRPRELLRHLQVWRRGPGPLTPPTLFSAAFVGNFGL